MAEEVRFELTRALRLMGLANPRNGPLCDSSCLAYYTGPVFDFLLDLVFPRFCVGCGRWGKFICSNCQKTIKFYDQRVNQVLPNLDSVFVLAHYDGVIRQAIKEIKYRGTFAINLELAELVRKHFRHQFPFDYIVPVPLAPKRLAQRGFNQAEKLARYLKLAPVLNCLTRTRETKPQFDLKIRQRAKNVRGAFATTNRHLPAASYCLIDDVATTGATLSECAKALKKAGAKKVYAICVARGS